MPHPKDSVMVPRRRGFSLVLSLTVMAMLLLLCIGAAALLTVELRVSRATASYAKARLNAMAGARIAFGEVQRLAGNDRRITATASVFDSEPSTSDQANGVALPRLTGVWRGKSVTSSYSATHDSSFAGWLVSGVGALQGETLLNYPKTTTLSADNAVRLLSAPSPAPASLPDLADKDAAEVYAAAEPVSGRPNDSSSGSIAWWVSDENQKANVSLRIPTETTPGAALQSAQNSPRFGLKLDSDGEFAGFPDTLPFNPAIITRGSLALDPGASGGKSWLTDGRNYSHHITPYSETLLTDVVNGGLKYDLSLLLAMDKLPVGYFGDTAYVALESQSAAANPYLSAKGKWITGDISASLGALPARNQKEWTCWGDVWNYARLYKHPAFSAAGMMMNSSADAHGNSSNPLDTQANVTDRQNLSPWREPVITQFQMVLGYRVKEIGTTGKYELWLVMRPYMQLWNPYNVPLRFTGVSADSILMRLVSTPGRLEITTTDSSGTGGSATANDITTLLSKSGNFNSFQSYVNFSSQLNTPMAPGEVRVLSPLTNSIVSSTAVTLAPQLRPFGGFETKINVPAFDGNVTVTMKPPSGAWYGNHIWNDIGRARYSDVYQKDSPGRGWLVVFRATDGSVSRQVMDFDTTPVTSTVGQLAGQGRFCSLITMRLRSEAVSTLKFPTMGYGDPLRWVYAPPAQSNYISGQGVRMSPYEFVHSKITSDTDAPPGNPIMQVDVANPLRGYAFTGYTPTTGVSSMVFSHIPLAPLGGLGELRDARLGGGVSYTRAYAPGGTEQQRMTMGASVVTDAFGNSFMHPMVAQTAISGTAAAFASENFYDFSWIMNAALWDSYCMTGLTHQDSPITALLPDGAPKPLEVVATNFFVKGKSLPNKRLLLRDYGVGGEAMKAELIDGAGPTPEGYAKSAAMMSVNGGFNINSTSVRAWRSLLSGLNGTYLPKVELNQTSISVSTVKVEGGGTPDNPVVRSPIQSGVLADVNAGNASPTFNQQRALAGRKLSDIQLTKLAKAIVEQVKTRGPFLSMGEFMNRRLESGVLGEKGALQAAIDASGVNDFATGMQVSAADVASLSLPNPKAVVGASGRGIPGFITQADLIGPVSSHITPRGDTFTIRACGTSDDGATAYVELVVRRSLSFVDGTDAPFVIADNLKTTNKAFGRRFQVVVSRWLKPEEI